MPAMCGASWPSEWAAASGAGEMGLYKSEQAGPAYASSGVCSALGLCLLLLSDNVLTCLTFKRWLIFASFRKFQTCHSHRWSCCVFWGMHWPGQVSASGHSLRRWWTVCWHSRSPCWRNRTVCVFNLLGWPGPPADSWGTVENLSIVFAFWFPLVWTTIMLPKVLPPSEIHFPYMYLKLGSCTPHTHQTGITPTTTTAASSGQPCCSPEGPCTWSWTLASANGAPDMEKVFWEHL